MIKTTGHLQQAVWMSNQGCTVETSPTRSSKKKKKKKWLSPEIYTSRDIQPDYTLWGSVDPLPSKNSLPNLQPFSVITAPNQQNAQTTRFHRSGQDYIGGYKS